MDVGMPRLNGLDATRRIREQPWGKAMTIIALTGWGQEGDRERSREAGCDGHLVKPVSLPDLEKVLERVVGDEARLNGAYTLRVRGRGSPARDAAAASHAVGSFVPTTPTPAKVHPRRTRRLKGSTGLIRCRSKPASRIRRQLSSLLMAVTATSTSGLPAAHRGAEPPRGRAGTECPSLAVPCNLYARGRMRLTPRPPSPRHSQGGEQGRCHAASPASATRGSGGAGIRYHRSCAQDRHRYFVYKEFALVRLPAHRSHGPEE